MNTTTALRFGFNIILPLSIVLLLSFCSTKPGEVKNADNIAPKKIGVLMVNHGSRSETWRNALLALETSVKDSILQTGLVKGTKTAFMEYNEPSIATRLKEFDKEGFTDVIIVPVFLTVSPHSFDDIPTIIGQKENPESMEALKLEKIERYTPKARTHLTPLLDFTDVLEKNILRRYKDVSKDPAKEGLVLMAYGDVTYVKEWSALLNNVGNYVSKNTGMSDFSFGWCGHIAHYNPDSTTVAINRVLRKKETAVVIPVLVAHDEMFQVKIIGDGIAKISNDKEKVIYRPDAILPDPNVEHWVIMAVAEQLRKITDENITAQIK
ncbi:MAG: CbiX/SirB N-terminal domain-containing protein [Bacteroidota bacterium]